MSSYKQQLEWHWRRLLFRLNELDVPQKIRRVSKQSRRKAIFVMLALLFFVYCMMPSSRSYDAVYHKRCLADRMRHYVDRAESAAAGLDSAAVRFAGNGYLGVGAENELLLKDPGSRVLASATGFHPLVDVVFPEAWSERVAEITDFETGDWRRIKCYDVVGECACVEERIFAHASRPEILVQEIKIINPTNTAIGLKLSRRKPAGWTQNTESGAEGAVETRETSKNGHSAMLAAVCSSVPATITISQKREEILSFFCAASQRQGTPGKGIIDMKKEAVGDVLKAFQAARAVPFSELAKEHEKVWTELLSTTFHISPSKAPDVLHGVQINATRYALLSNAEARGLLLDEASEERHTVDRQLGQLGKCYIGHSALLYPSKLWHPLTTTVDVQNIAEVWFLTLEKRGCGDLLNAGARGVSKAFVLSLLAASFDQNHLELGIDPADLHRQMRASNLPMPGASKALVDVNLHLDEENVNYMLVSASDQLFACAAGCQDDPLTLSLRPVKLPVKLTKPLTAILYVATSRRHLQQLRAAIHVSEVAHAPAHENEVIALHEHGHKLGGIPTIVWVFLGLLLITFHVFLVKLLWTEWRKGDTTPYNPFLRNRYLRTH